MTRHVALALCCTAVSIGVLGAAPARPLYEPPEAPKPPAALLLAGTTWEGKLLAGANVQVVFEPGGVLVYRSSKSIKGKASPGAWTLNGNQVSFEINKFSEHRGIINGNVMEGESSNKNGQRGNFRLQRVER